jgi:hypothetical protein
VDFSLHTPVVEAKRFEYLAEAVEAVDDAARKVFTLALFS